MEQHAFVTITRTRPSLDVMWSPRFNNEDLNSLTELLMTTKSYSSNLNELESTITRYGLKTDVENLITTRLDPQSIMHKVVEYEEEFGIVSVISEIIEVSPDWIPS